MLLFAERQYDVERMGCIFDKDVMIRLDMASGNEINKEMGGIMLRKHEKEYCT